MIKTLERLFAFRFFHSTSFPLLITNARLARRSSLFSRLNFHFYLIAVLSFAVLFAKLHIGDLSGYDDAVYAHEGRHMLRSGDWWNVWLNGELDFDKPPLFVWLEALAMMLCGVSDFAAKAPSALLGLGTILLIYFLARELSDQDWLPVWGMLVLVGTHFFMKQAMHAMTDVSFTFFFTLAILGHVKGLRQPRSFILCGVALAAAILTRSILGLIPLGIILMHLFLIGRADLLRSGWLICGLALAVGLPLIWFVSQYQLHGDEFISRHFSFTVENLPHADHHGLRRLASGVFTYPLLLIKTHWPWLPLILVGFWRQTKKMIGQRDLAGSLLVIWVVCVMVPFSLIETKALRYILPAFPAFAMLAAMTLHGWIPARGRAFTLKMAYSVMALVILALALNPKYHVRPEEMRRLAPVAQASTPPDEHILLYTNREPEWAHLYQVIWYAERRGHLLTKINDLISRLERSAETSVITDKEVFTQTLLSLSLRFEVLGETENFICFRPLQAATAVPAQPIENLQIAENKK